MCFKKYSDPLQAAQHSLVEATEHGGITVIRSMRFEAVMEMFMELNDSIFNDANCFIVV